MEMLINGILWYPIFRQTQMVLLERFVLGVPSRTLHFKPEAEDTQSKAALYLAKEVETQIHKALKDEIHSWLALSKTWREHFPFGWVLGLKTSKVISPCIADN